MTTKNDDPLGVMHKSLSFKLDDIEKGEHDSPKFSSTALSSGVGCTEHHDHNGVTRVSNDNLLETSELDENLSGLRAIICIILLLITVIGSAIVYTKIHGNEVNSFEANYHSHAHLITDSIRSNLQQDFLSMNALSISITSYANLIARRTMNTNTTITNRAASINQTTTFESSSSSSSSRWWPFITVPDFSALTSEIRSLSGATSLLFAPVVTLDKREEWEEYSIHNLGWIDEGIVLQQQEDQQRINPRSSSSSNSNSNERGNRRRRAAAASKTLSSPIEALPLPLIRHGIHTINNTNHNDDDYHQNNKTPNTVPATGPGPFFPIWQTTPVMPDLVGFDLFSSSEFAHEIHAVMTSKEAIITHLHSNGTTKHIDDGDFDDNNDTYLDYVYTSESDGIDILPKLQSATNTKAGYNPISSHLLLPVFDQLRLDKVPSTSNEITNNNDETQDPTKSIVGILFVDIIWENYFENILPEHTPPMVAVLANDCVYSNDYDQLQQQPQQQKGGQFLTFRLVGNEAIFLGPGDLHDTRFDEYLHTASLSISKEQRLENFHYYENNNSSEVLDEDNNIDGLNNNGNHRHGRTVSLNNFCHYDISVYPTKQYQKSFLTNKPWIYVGSAVGLTMFMAIVLFMYMTLVEHRQYHIMAKAIQADKLVSEIFPNRVRERLYLCQEDNHKKKSRRDIIHFEDGHKIINDDESNSDHDIGVDMNQEHITNIDSLAGRSGFALLGTAIAPTPMNSSQTNILDPNMALQAINQHTSSYLRTAANRRSINGQNRTKSNKPIADLFPNTTVFFADITGFTAWCSQREPTEAFILLQTIFERFDSIAKRLNVFKVETVGESYVAVTGLPEPQDDHVIRMFRFARECLNSVKGILRDLELTLGPGTEEDLSVRIGIHTGPVTAGVLQGTKSRFQLFGDTMNTTSRHLTSCPPNRIQCSAAAAKLLSEKERRMWLRKRQDLVRAKGKGEVQTYWVEGLQVIQSPSSLTDDENEHSLTAFEGDLRPVNTNQDNNNDDNNIYHHTDGFPNPADDTSLDAFGFDRPASCILNKRQRLIEWHVALFSTLLKKIQAARGWKQQQEYMLTGKKKKSKRKLKRPSFKDVEFRVPGGSSAVDEIKEIIALPEVDTDHIYLHNEFHKSGMLAFDMVGIRGVGDDGGDNSDGLNDNKMQLNPLVVTQLHDYITSIAFMYLENPFHCFEHATHVTMSTYKLLKEVISSHSELNKRNGNNSSDNFTIESDMGYISGIASNPLTQFALVFSALIHDVDHQGVSNYQLIEEKAPMARMYRRQSVQEQNSVDIAWDLLMDPMYKDLRRAIYADEHELQHFRQILVNVVLATDIFDKNMKSIREKRWDRAFQYSYEPEPFETSNDGNGQSQRPSQRISRTKTPATKRSSDISIIGGNGGDDEQRGSGRFIERNHRWRLSTVDGINLKATIVMEHLIQASDVAHTMQHWDVYLKWNEKFFYEMYNAYKNGRTTNEKDPSKTWYEGEIMFFDKYIIPLAEKLSQSNVFGVSSDEYLSYALQNRTKWAVQGDTMVAKFMENIATQKVEEKQNN